MTALVQRFDRNTAGRDLIVGDIHGHFSRLQRALDRVGFDPERDRLFSVGDLVDRGPESELYADWLARPWFHAVCGNHEDMAIRWPSGRMDRDIYLSNGGGWNAWRPSAEQRNTADEFSALPVVIEIETLRGKVGIVHADVPFHSWQDFVECLEHERGPVKDVMHNAMWSRDRINHGNDNGVRGIRAVVVGHTPINEVRVLGNVIHIDTGGWLGVEGGQWGFTLLDAETLEPVTHS